MPSKLFVGNLPDNVDSTKLKQIFQPFCKVTECDIVKNYAFVHVEEEDVDSIIARLTGYTIDGCVVNIKKSTSKLRPTPGMPNRCFRCQSDEHRTPQCPQDPSNQKKNEFPQTIKIDLTSGSSNGSSLKRVGDPILDSAKRIAYQTPSTVDVEVPQPADPDLQQLYQEYQLSRQRYVYYRDRLLKEMEAKQHGSTTAFALSSATQMPVASPMVVANSTQLSAAPVSYQPVQSTVQPVIQHTPVPAYSAVPAANLRAPYAAPSAPYTNAVPSVPPMQPVMSNNVVQQPVVQQYGLAPQTGVMTTQQYLQQMQNSQPPAQSTSIPQPPIAPGGAPKIMIKWQ